MADEETTPPSNNEEATTETKDEPLEPSAPPPPEEEVTESLYERYHKIDPLDPRPSILFDVDRPPVKLSPPPADIRPPTMFGLIPERCVTFCVDTSGSMFQSLHVVKEHLMETISAMAAREDESMFNLIEFNSQVTQWADKMVQCTKETVEVARSWINKLMPKSGTNTQDALLTAFADPGCQAVYLVSDGLPDQYPEEVLDRVLAVCGNRRVHCIYVTGEKADEVATEFMEDLAVETFGSFHIVTLTTHGCVEKITPIYRSDHAHEKIVHTVNNTLRPNIKTCSVSTTLQIDPDEILGNIPRTSGLVHPAHPYLVSPALLHTYPHSYYYPYYWTRYRPAKSWLRAQDKLDESGLGLSPSAGSLLIGKKVLARRIDDGYFYKATVQSQNLDGKFLIAFGPCKHGKYRQVEYQDTYVFDIVDYYDALRHTIINGDRVLAPYEPDGDRFAPGIVIAGHEKRHAEGPEDQDLTIAFSNGHTEKIVRDLAVWIPDSVHERVALELKMPKEARETLLSNADMYPLENLPGYPTSGPRADPVEYPQADPFIIESSYHLWDPHLYRYPPYLPAYCGYPPFVISPRRGRRQVEKEAKGTTDATNEDAATVIPGTNMTKQELEDHVLSQITEHKLTVESGGSRAAADSQDVTCEKVNTGSRLLGRREKLEENGLKKSVTFSEREEVEPRNKDGKEFDDSAYDEYGNIIQTTDAAVNTDSSLLFYRSSGIESRPRWNYWRNDDSPSYSEISGGIGIGGKRPLKGPGPFRETALQAPLEARDQREPPYNVEWTSPAFKYVDTFAKHDYSNSVEECLGAPKPPPKKNAAEVKRTYLLASRPVASMTPEEREEARRALRRRRVLKRENDWQNRMEDEDRMKNLMQDNHRERILQQMDRDRQRQIQEERDIHLAREAKKKISKELRQRIEVHQKEEQEKETRRIDALRKRRERREEIQAQRDKEIQQTMERRDEIRKQNNEARLSSWTEKLNEQEAKETAVTKQHQNAKLRRVNHWRELERQGQQRKDLRIAVTEQHQAQFLSQIFA